MKLPIDLQFLEYFLEPMGECLPFKRALWGYSIQILRGYSRELSEVIQESFVGLFKRGCCGYSGE